MDDPSTSGVTEGFGLMFYNARMYDPALGRFTSADSIVPAGVQGYDRYAYTNNNPVKYVDPSGHSSADPCHGAESGYKCRRDLAKAGANSGGGGFTDGAIHNYLMNYCRGSSSCAAGIFQTWQSDGDWWDMLTSAQAGDVLFGTQTCASCQFSVTFTGVGNTILTGITGVVGGGTPTLINIQQGSFTGIYRRSGFYQEFTDSISWIGFYRLPEKYGEDIYWHLRSGYTKTDLGARGLKTGTQVLIVMASAAIGYGVCGGIVTTAVGASLACAGGTGAAGAMAIDGLDLQETDHAYEVGPLYFNFQFNADTYTITLEHIK
jgi:RHS repeat-associated protein